MDMTLEYNEQQQCWHISRPGSREPDTFGWVTICERYPERLTSAFCCLADERYARKATLKQARAAWKVYEHTIEILAGFRVNARLKYTGRLLIQRF